MDIVVYGMFLERKNTNGCLYSQRERGHESVRLRLPANVIYTLPPSERNPKEQAASVADSCHRVTQPQPA